MAALADVPAEVRGTVMGLNSTVASGGWLAAAAVGGWIIADIGFAGFGPLIAGLTVAAAIIALARWRR
jgi:predicted MFS family arabinose efflux permease